MNTLLRATYLGLAIAALSGTVLISQGVDPIAGTWELNVAKSKFSPGPAPKNQTRTYVVAGAEVKATVKGTSGEGKPIAAEFTMTDDGKEHPMPGNPDADTVAVKRVDANTVTFTLKRAGKIVATGTRTISKDGKTMTLTSKGTNARGQAIDNVEVFEKK